MVLPSELEQVDERGEQDGTEQPIRTRALKQRIERAEEPGDDGEGDEQFGRPNDASANGERERSGLQEERRTECDQEGGEAREPKHPVQRRFGEVAIPERDGNQIVSDYNEQDDNPTDEDITFPFFHRSPSYLEKKPYFYLPVFETIRLSLHRKNALRLECVHSILKQMIGPVSSPFKFSFFERTFFPEDEKRFF